MIRVGVIRGGISPEYDISLKTGSEILRAIDSSVYKAVDILITKDGEWHLNGLPVNEEKLKLNVDVVWNALHGHFGEDGKLQQFLERLGIPYVGSTALASAMSHNKMLTRDHLASLGYLVPKSRVFKYLDEDMIEMVASDLFRTIVPPWIVKPLKGGSSIDTFIARSYDELVRALTYLSGKTDEVLVEEFVYGEELFTGVVEGHRNASHYTFPVFCIKSKHSMLCTEDRMGGEYRFELPRHLSDDVKKEIEAHAESIHKALGLRDYSSVDFIKSPKGLYVIEVDAYPALHEHSPFARALSETGVMNNVFVDTLLKRALKRK